MIQLYVIKGRYKNITKDAKRFFGFKNNTDNKCLRGNQCVATASELKSAMSIRFIFFILKILGLV